MRKRALGLAVALIVGAFVVSASGAATTQAQKVTTINVSTRSAVIHYLRSIHVNAKHAVIQRGLRNYAGAHCPGAHWTCASTKHTVVQIAKRGGQNRFVCRSSKCVVVQISGTAHGVYVAGRVASAPVKPGSTATCVKTGSGATTGGGQTCVINQSGTGPNLAGVYENTNKVSGLMQTAQYSASITQTSSGSNGNTACVTQNITLDGSNTNTNGKPTTVNLEALQSITITQDSPGGNNSAGQAATSTGACDTTTSAVAQSQTLTSTVSATGNITQLENPSPGSGLTTGNVSIDIEQNQGSAHGSATGANNAAFTQTYNQTAIARTTSGHFVTQQQSSPDGDGLTTPFSGLVGTINQDSAGISTAVAKQNETQCEDAFNAATDTLPLQCDTNDPDGAPAGINLTQAQYGPEGIFTPAAAHHSSRVPFAHKGKGTSSQTGNPGGGDTFKLTQTSKQDNDNGPQTTQSNIIQGDCNSVGGSCQAGQSATLNGQDTGDGYTAGSITGLVINCPNGHSTCTATPPPDPTLTATPPVDINGDTTATSASFEFTDPARDATFNCTLDTVTVNSCGSPSVIHGLLDGTKTYNGLPIGQHTFTVTATDSSGNPSGTTATFTWTIAPPCSIGAGNGPPFAYTAIPSDIATCPAASESFEADADNEFGDEVTLATTAGTSLKSMTVDFQSWGCETGHWYDDTCASTPGDGFTIPGGLTAKIYAVGAGDTLGPVIATSTVNPTIPYRPSADDTNCTGGDAGKWFDSVAGVCRNGYSALVTFSNWSFPNGAHSFANGEKVIWTVQYNTSDAGYNPIGQNTPCFGSSGGCGYDSLNVGAMSFANAPYAGTDVSADTVFISYDLTYGGTQVPLGAQTGWTGYRPLGKIVLG